MSATASEQSEDESTPIPVRRPPRSRLIYSPPRRSAAPEPMPSIPVTSPTKQWDRCELSATPFRDIWREETESLDDPLPAGTPRPEGSAGAIIICALRILLGHQAPGTLRNWLTPEVFAILTRRAGLAFRLNGRAPKTPPPRILRMHVGHPRSRVTEVTAVAHDGIRTRAIGLRLEFWRKRWKVVALQIG